MPPSEKIKIIELMTSLRNEISDKMESWEKLQDVHNKAHTEAIQHTNKLMGDHEDDDKTNFGELGSALAKLNNTIASLQSTVDGLRGAFIPWPWFIGTMITLLVIVGGAIAGVYMKLDNLDTRIAGIEYEASKSIE